MVARDNSTTGAVKAEPSGRADGRALTAPPALHPLGVCRNRGAPTPSIITVTPRNAGFDSVEDR